MLIGYARVSTASQNLDRQVAALNAAGCTMIFTEKASGKSIHNRPELEKALSYR
jgi:DNA invertase Pin-like site-specific DNA recombinase